MKIAIIAWGSLVWDPRTLPYKGDWELNGPVLCIEFSRVSNDGRLTLVVDGDNGVQVPTRFATSTRTELHDAVADLQDREGTILKRIGFVNCTDDSNSAGLFSQPGDTFQNVREWSKKNGFDATIWTALPGSFKEKTGEDFSLHAAEAYLKRLPKTTQKIALQYVIKAPKEVKTPLRKHLEECGLISTAESQGAT